MFVQRLLHTGRRALAAAPLILSAVLAHGQAPGAGPAAAASAPPAANVPAEAGRLDLRDLGVSVPRPVRAATAALGMGRPRLALVVGIGRIGSKLVLDSAARDTQAVAQVLRAGGFVVMQREDLDAADLRATLQEFHDRLLPDSIGLAYFTGLGTQVGGQNLLLPRDVPLDDATPQALAAQLRSSAVPLAEVVNALMGTAEGARMLVVDAAYQHPALARLPAPGLVEQHLPPGVMALFGQALGSLQDVPAVAPLPSPPPTAAAEIAATRFARVLVGALAKPRISGPDALRTTRRAIFDATLGQANPWLGGDTDEHEELAESTLLDSLVPQTPEDVAREAARQATRLLTHPSSSGEQSVAEVLQQAQTAPPAQGATAGSTPAAPSPSQGNDPSGPERTGLPRSPLSAVGDVVGTAASVAGAVATAAAATAEATSVAAGTVSTAAATAGTGADMALRVAGSLASATAGRGSAAGPVATEAANAAASRAAAAAAPSIPAGAATAVATVASPAIIPQAAPAGTASLTPALATPATSTGLVAVAPPLAAAHVPAAAVAGAAGAAGLAATTSSPTPRDPRALDGRTVRSPEGGERPAYQPRRNAFGYAEGDTFTYQVIDRWKDEATGRYTTAIDEVQGDGKMFANGHQVELDAEGRYLRLAGSDGSVSSFAPCQQLWWSRPKRGEDRAVKFVETFQRADRSRGVTEWKGSASVGRPRRIHLPAGDFEVLPIESSGWYTETLANGTRTIGHWSRTVWYSSALGHPVAIDIEDADPVGKMLRRERVELLHVQAARGTPAP